MNEFMQKMALLQQMQPPQGQQHGEMPPAQEHPMQNYNPISRGASEAMNSVRQSLDMDPRQKRRAMGVAIMNLASNMGMPAPGSGFSGALGSISQGMNPALQAYLHEQDKYEGLNQKLLQRHDELQKQQRHEYHQRQQLARQMAHDDQQMSLLRDRFNHDVNRESMANMGESEDGVISLSSMPPSIRKGYEDELRADEKQGQEAFKVLKIGDKMLAEIQKYPDLYTDFSRTLLPKNERKLGITDYARIKMMPKEKKAAIERFSKLSNSLVLNQIKGTSGKAMTDMMKGFLTEVVPNAGMTDDAKKYMIETYKEEFLPLYERGMVANEARRKRVWIPKDMQTYRSKVESTMSDVESDEPEEGGISQLSNEQLKALGASVGIQ